MLIVNLRPFIAVVKIAFFDALMMNSDDHSLTVLFVNKGYSSIRPLARIVSINIKQIINNTSGINLV